MAFHHVAFATRDLAATHAFYTEAMGFELVTAEAIATPGGGWARPAFYGAGDGLPAVWVLEERGEGAEAACYANQSSEADYAEGYHSCWMRQLSVVKLAKLNVVPVASQIV